MRFIQSLKLAGLLSFPPDMEPFELESLNVLIGPNGSGKSNLIEAFELLRALPTDFAKALREGGGTREWIWKGELPEGSVKIELTAQPRRMLLGHSEPLDYKLYFEEAVNRVFVYREIISKSFQDKKRENPTVYYSNENGEFGLIIEILERTGREISCRELAPSDVKNDQSILAQIRDPAKYREMTALSVSFASIQTFRDWSFGRDAAFRQPQRADLPDHVLLQDAKNLAVIVNQVENWGKWQEFNDLLKRFFPRFERLSTAVIGGTVQLYFHETGFDTPIPATRISDGTLRFIAMLAVLLSPEPPPLLCIEEPELGLHPDAVALMAEVLSEASERMQLVVTTHSDALVSALTNRPSAIVACERPGAGTMLRRLDPERLSDLLEDYTLGHLWRQGELGANP